MKPGSIVECVRAFSPEVRLNHRHLTFPVKGKHYTIRAIFKQDGCLGVLLEEVRNKPVQTLDAGFKEQCFEITFFREILFPSDLTDAINELLTEPILVEA